MRNLLDDEIDKSSPDSMAAARHNRHAAIIVLLIIGAIPAQGSATRQPFATVRRSTPLVSRRVAVVTGAAAILSAPNALLAADEEDVDLRPTAVCFLDFEIDAAPAGRVTIELYGNAVPRTVANFKDLAVGKPGFGYKVSSCTTPSLRARPTCTHTAIPITAATPCAQGTSVYRVVNGLTIQAGDIVRDDGTSGRSIYGESFERESFRVPHSGEGFVSMVNSPAGTVDSRFLIDTRADGSQYLDGKYVGFGRVKDGMEIVHKIEALPTTGTKNAPRAHVVIANSGVLP